MQWSKDTDSLKVVTVLSEHGNGNRACMHIEPMK